MPDDPLEVARALAAQAAPGEAIEAYVLHSRDTDVDVLRGDVESLTVAEQAGVGIRVVRDGRQGYAWAGALDPSVLDDTLAEARDNATFAAPDPWLGLPTPDEAAHPSATLDLWRDDLAAVPTDMKVELALALEAATAAADARVRAVESAGYHDSAIEAAVASSLGVEATTRRTSCSCGVSALAGGADDTRTGYGFSVGRTLEDLDVDAAASDAATRAVRLLGAVQPPTQQLPVVLDPLVTASVLSLIGAALNGEAVLKGRSMFAGRDGEQVAAPIVTLVDDPTDARARGAATHDGEGVPTRRTPLLDGGTLRGFLQNVYTGRRSGAGTTGAAVRGLGSPPGVGARALAVAPGDRDPDAIVASLPAALYVQSVSGLHSGTSPVSGDFSVGAVGLMIRDGAFAEPVREVTVASTLQRMLLDVVEVGADLTWLPGAAAGATLVIGEMQVSGS
ncbi:MAG TPA: TldD/PmbA family protein [Acidimicrobiia bacterium]|jgi:PmbA protein|nr:TldD/PmbA family protein [Acidimicrobiia bacterium]